MRRALVLATLALLACSKQKRHGNAGDIHADRSRLGIELLYRYDLDHADGIFVPVDKVMSILRQRLARAGLDDAVVLAALGPPGIVVRLPGLDPPDLARVKHLITTAGRVEFAMVDDESPYLRELADRAKGDDGAARRHVTVGHYGYDQGSHHVEELFLLAPDRAALQGYLAEVTGTLPEPPGRRLRLESQAAQGDERPAQWRSYLLGPAELDNTGIASADVRYDPQQPTRAEVEVELTAQGAARFEALTEANVGRRMAIVLDGQVNSAPIIQTKIAGGEVRITMGGSDDRQAERDATDLANLLRSVPQYMPLIEVPR